MNQAKNQLPYWIGDSKLTMDPGTEDAEHRMLFIDLKDVRPYGKERGLFAATIVFKVEPK